MTTISAHEAWCPQCRVTHPPGTRRCLHCGGPVMPSRPPEGGAAPGPVLREGPFAPWPDAEGRDEEAAPPNRAVRGVRVGMAALWIAIAIATAIARACAERG